MKKLFFILFSVLLVVSCSPKKVYLFTSFHEPATAGLRLLYSYDGYHWTDFDTTFLQPSIDEKVMRDPSMVQSPDGTFHLVWTSAWKGAKGFGYASSKDLLHWSPQQLIEVMKNEPTTVNIWAPELFYDRETAQFIIVWASTIPFRFPRGEEDEDNNHRLYYTTTKDFKTFTPVNLFLDPGFSAIDAEIVQRGKEDYVLVVKDNTRPNRNIKVAFAQHALGPYSAASQPFTVNFTEGPSATKVGNNWLVYFDQYRDKIYGAVQTKDFKTFENITNKVLVPAGHKHGTILQIKKSFFKKLKRAVDAQHKM